MLWFWYNKRFKHCENWYATSGGGGAPHPKSDEGVPPGIFYPDPERTQTSKTREKYTLREHRSWKCHEFHTLREHKYAKPVKNTRWENTCPWKGHPIGRHVPIPPTYGSALPRALPMRGTLKCRDFFAFFNPIPLFNASNCLFLLSWGIQVSQRFLLHTEKEERMWHLSPIFFIVFI